jgi:nucleoside-diphosphate-sugar epimerase
MSRYLVTGGAGFIGTNLVIKLKAAGHNVVVLDNFAGGKKTERLQGGVEYVEGDIRSKSDLDKACIKQIDGIFHLAALPRVTFSVENPELTHDVNVNGLLQVLEAARRHHIKRLIFSSSSSAPGTSEIFPTPENIPTAPISPYALHKLIGEHYCRLYASFYGIETVCLRYFNVYGPYFDPEGAYALVVGKFIKQVKNKQPMTVCGDGKYYRDLVHVHDVANANMLAMTSNNVGAGDIINIGTGESHHVVALAELIGGKNYVFVAERPGDLRKTQADYSKAKQLLGWEPTIKLEEGVKELKKEMGI